MSAFEEQNYPVIRQRGFYSDILTQEAEEHLGVSNLDFLFCQC